MLVISSFILVGLILFWQYFSTGAPPGIDTPTFLHFSWLVEQSILGRNDAFLNDPYWYGGFPYLQVYPPLSYVVIGTLAALSPIDIEIWYRLLTLTGVIGLPVSVYWVCRGFQLSEWVSWWAGVLTLLSYPLYATVGLWGSMPTVVALPLGLTAFGMLERSFQQPNSRHALIGGALLAANLLTHHMTAAVIVLSLALLIGYRAATYTDTRVILRNLSRFSLAALGLSVIWAAPFLYELTQVGFRREVPGLWSFQFDTFRSQFLNRRTIGFVVYPYYLGWLQVPLALAGITLAAIDRSRMTSVALVALIVFWLSLGEANNFLVRLYPLSGLDVSRLAFILTPFMSILAAYTVSRLLSVQRDSIDFLKRPAAQAFTVALLVALLLIPLSDALRSRSTLSPVQPPPTFELAEGWLNENQSNLDSSVYVIGLGNWDAYWMPRRIGTRLIDGWYDEGARDWKDIREIRQMGWTGQIDLDRFHEIVSRHAADHVAVFEWEPNENPGLFREVLEERPDLFALSAQWDGLAIFETK